MIKEVCVEYLDGAKIAEAMGATQVELCGRLDLDGITPDMKLVEEVLNSLSIHTKVMVRPRGGDFVYSEDEVDEMAVTIEILKKMGVQEIVLGLLTEQNNIDLATTKKLAQLAAPMNVTFHKAIDELKDPAEGVRQLLAIPEITGVLTSGGKPTAKEGAENIKRMIEAAQGKIQIIAAGKVTDKNLLEIDQLIGADAYHGKLIVGELG
ncbi:copper homeostasis protein CutC [Reichenbachiella sp.]|uniref:copper homeostasis protein CutC n=1 Tax=Reichenbachiella sp. TaxID=2184521 RepID=UPI003B5BA2A7